jgi:p-hydroxybenzoate 3-monooxygenase
MLAVSDDDLQDLRSRLRRTRWPTPWPGTGWEAGTDSAELRRLVEYWASGYDRRTQEAAVNALPSHLADFDGQPVHYLRFDAEEPGALTRYERAYPFAWLGILAQAPASSDELIYARHERGFALHSMRTPQIIRMYLQVARDADLTAWPDTRIWDELDARLATGAGFHLTHGPVLERGITPMRSLVTEPMRYGRLFLAGDAAHIVPPTGAKGLNLAVADVRILAEALIAHYRDCDDRLLGEYSARCLRRVWPAQRFSSWMTTMLHRRPDDDEFANQLQLAELACVTGSTAAATTLAENYVGWAVDTSGSHS